MHVTTKKACLNRTDKRASVQKALYIPCIQEQTINIMKRTGGYGMKFQWEEVKLHKHKREKVNKSPAFWAFTYLKKERKIYVKH